MCILVCVHKLPLRWGPWCCQDDFEDIPEGIGNIVHFLRPLAGGKGSSGSFLAGADCEEGAPLTE